MNFCTDEHLSRINTGLPYSVVIRITEKMCVNIWMKEEVHVVVEN